MPNAEHHDLKLFLFRSTAVMLVLVMCAVGSIYFLETNQFTELSARALAVSAIIVIFVLCYCWSMYAIYRQQELVLLRLLWVEAALILCLLALSREVMTATYYISFWIARTPHNYPLRTCLLLTLGASALFLAASFLRGEETPLRVQLLIIVPTLMFVLSVSFTAINERRLRLEAVALNQQLKMAQERLAQASRQSERLRIARDVHDMLGHHMTALSLNLEVASHQVEGAALAHIRQARELARQMLADLRETVSDLRDDRLDFRQALNVMLARIPQLQVTLDLQDDLVIDDPDTADILLRCIQEGMTNTLRHAQARTCRIRLHAAGGKLLLEISDDGSGTADIVPGNGLKGMRERLQQLAGSLQWHNRDGGFILQASLPLRSAAS